MEVGEGVWGKAISCSFALAPVVPTVSVSHSTFISRETLVLRVDHTIVRLRLYVLKPHARVGSIYKGKFLSKQ